MLGSEAGEGIMRRIIIVAALLVGSCQELGKDSITPGMWSSTLTLKAGNEELWTASLDRCVSSNSAAELALSSLRVGQLQDCNATKSSADGGQFSIQARCPERQTIQANVPMMPGWLASKVALDGRYTAETMTGEMTAELEDTLEPMKFAGTLSARRKGDC